MRRILLVSVFAVLAVFAAPSLIQADTVNFDNVVAPADFIQVPSYSPFVATGCPIFAAFENFLPSETRRF